MWVYSRYSGLVQHSKVSEYNLLYQQAKLEKNHMILSIEVEEGLVKIQQPLQ